MSTPSSGDGPDDEPGPGSVGTTGPGPLVVLGAVAAVVGWAIRPVTLHLGVAEPVVSLWSMVVVGLVVLGVASTAWRTWRLLQRGRPAGARLEPHQAVNRLVLGKAAAMLGALLLGGYAGFALAHIGIPPTELSGQRLVRGAVSALGGLLLMVSGLVLERACRVRSTRE